MCWFFVLEVTTGNVAGFSPSPFSFPLPVTIPPLFNTVMSLPPAVYSNALQVKLLWFYSLYSQSEYSGTSNYRSHNDRFPACTVRHFWFRMKFHINNVIYSCIHRSRNYRFTALIVCKSRSPRSISRMDRLKKKWSEVFIICVNFCLDYKSGNTVTHSRFARCPQLRVRVSSVISELYFGASGSVLSHVIPSIWFICFH